MGGTVTLNTGITFSNTCGVENIVTQGKCDPQVLGNLQTVSDGVVGMSSTVVNAVGVGIFAVPLLATGATEVGMATQGLTMLGPGLSAVGASFSAAWNQLSNILNAGSFSVPSAVWDQMVEDGVATSQLQNYINSAISAGNQIVTTMNPSQAAQGSWFAAEVNYLTGLGYTFVQTGSTWTAVKN
jgi:hypothetical protein